MHRKSVLAALVVVAVGVVAVGIAYAAVGGGGVIQACYKANGDLHVIGTNPTVHGGKCNKDETALDWNQQGTQGIQGEKGDKGDTGGKGEKGDTGPAGASDAYTNYGSLFVEIGAGLTKTVASVTVPAGSYVLSASVQGLDIDNGCGVLGGCDFEFLQCFFVASVVHTAYALFTRDATVPLLGDATLAFPLNPVFLRCNAHAGTVQARGQIIATKVGTITPSE